MTSGSAADVTLEPDGALSVEWPADEATFLRAFDYTICCDSSTCDTATVTITFIAA